MRNKHYYIPRRSKLIYGDLKQTKAKPPDAHWWMKVDENERKWMTVYENG